MKILQVNKPGPFSIIQDSGRYGYQRYGLAPAGAMDEVAYRLGNYLLGNSPEAASLEFTIKGPELEVSGPTYIAVTGGPCEITVNDEKVYPPYAPIRIETGDRVSIGAITEGTRGYLSLAGGIDVPSQLSSRSTYLRGKVGGIEGRPVQAGDEVYTAGRYGSIGRPLPTAKWPVYKGPFEVDVIMGPQEEFFTEKGIHTFLSETFTISKEADRMGYRLNGPEIEHEGEADIISDGIPLGAVQVPGHRQPIIMMKDRQTTGGYPKIATTASYEIYRLGQARPGEQVKFNKVTLEEAKDKREKYEQWFKQLVEYIRQPAAQEIEYEMYVNKKPFRVKVTEI